MLPGASRGRNEAGETATAGRLAGRGGWRDVSSGPLPPDCRLRVSAMPRGSFLAPGACSHPLSSNLPLLCIFHFLLAAGPHTERLSYSFVLQLQFLASSLDQSSLCLLPLTTCSPATITYPRSLFLKNLQFGSGSSTEIPNPWSGPHATQHPLQVLYPSFPAVPVAWGLLTHPFKAPCCVEVSLQYQLLN